MIDAVAVADPAELDAVITAVQVPITPSADVSLPVRSVRVVISLRGFVTTIDALVADAPAFQLKVTLVVLRIAELGLKLMLGTGTDSGAAIPASV